MKTNHLMLAAPVLCLFTFAFSTSARADRPPPEVLTDPEANEPLQFEASLACPLDGNNFWKGFGCACEAFNAGDPIIQFDKLAHRWVASQGVFGPYVTCIAVSTTPDALGTYFRFAFPQSGFPDYPKFG